MGRQRTWPAGPRLPQQFQLSIFLDQQSRNARAVVAEDDKQELWVRGWQTHGVETNENLAGKYRNEPWSPLVRWENHRHL